MHFNKKQVYHLDPELKINGEKNAYNLTNRILGNHI